MLNGKLDKIIKELAWYKKDIDSRHSGETYIKPKEVVSEHVSGVNLENLMVQTSYICKIGIVTEKAVGILNSDASKIAWIPKKAIKNLDKIVVIQGLTPEIIVHDWFAYKVKWVENKPPEDNRQ